MSDSPITQVSRNNNSPITQVDQKKKKKKRGFLCCGSKEVEELDDYSSNNQSSSSSSNNQQSQQNNNDGQNQALLPPLKPEHKGMKCLVLDLDETLVHSSFTPVPNADFIIPVEIENHVHQVYVLKRPGVDHFMKTVGSMWEVVVFTASLAKYADPVMDLLDKHKVVSYRLFRESCNPHHGNYVKDLGRMGRSLKDVVIIDNSPASYMFNTENAIPIDSWFDDENDTELLDLLPFLEELSKVDDVAKVIAKARAAS